MSREPVNQEVGPPPGATPRGAAAWPARLVGALAWLVRAVVVLSLASLLLFTIGSVLDRHVFRTDLLAFDQYSRVGLVWLTFLGIAIGFRERANIRIDLLDHVLPARLGAPKAALLDVIVLVVAGLMIVVGWRLLEVGAFQVLMDTVFTYETMYGALLLGLSILCVFLVVRLVDAATGRRLGLDAPPGDHDRP